MTILMACPARVHAGGVESIHKFAQELNKVKGMDVKILYMGSNLNYPQLPEYAEYGIDYTISFPEDYTDVIIFPEIWANWVVEPKYKNCIKVVHWLGVDGYYWNNPVEKHGLYLKQTDVLHLTQTDYATEHLLKNGVDKNKIAHITDVPNSLFYEDFEDKPRTDVVLYNPARMTEFQKILMRRATGVGITFRPLENLTREEMAQTMQESKLYIDFGVFPGKERIPREAALSGCCVITSKLGCAKYYNDVSLDDKWKFDTVGENIPKIIDTMKYILQNYDTCKAEFSSYRDAIIKDRENLPKDCRVIAKFLLGAKNAV